MRVFSESEYPQSRHEKHLKSTKTNMDDLRICYVLDHESILEQGARIRDIKVFKLAAF